MPSSRLDSSTLKAIFLDAAGTLIHLKEPVGVTYSRFGREHGLEFDAPSLETAFRSAWKSLPQPQHQGTPPLDDDKGWWRELVRRCFETLNGSPVPASQFEPLFEHLYAHYAQSEAWQVFPDVLPALDHLRQHYPLYILSNFDRRLRRLLNELGLSPFFEGQVNSSEVGASKPHPLIFSAAAKLANCPSSQCLHIGDDPKCDLKGAAQSGFQAVLLERGRQTLLDIAQKIAPFPVHDP